MKTTLRTIKQMLIIGVLAVLCCIGLLLVSTLIPQKLTEGNAKKSADYYSSALLFENMINGQEATKRDNYADCITSSIAWHLGRESSDTPNVFLRILKAEYTQGQIENVNEGFRRAVYENAKPNRTYSRYWHGNAAVIRLLYPITDISGMRIFFFVLGLLLTLLFILYLVIKKEYILAVSYLAGLVAIKAAFSFLCFEYSFVNLLVPVFSFLLYRAAEKYEDDGMVRKIYPQTLFLLAGILTCFFDFLTAETLTFTVPAFVFFAAMEKKQSRPKKPLRLFFSTGFSWLIGYAGMFLLKWILALIFLGSKEFALSVSVAAERSIGAVHETQNLASPTVGFAGRILGIFSRNFACLFGLSGKVGERAAWVIMLGIFAGIALLWFFLRKNTKGYKYIQKGKKEASFFPVYLMLILLPIGRFFALSNHSYLHYFFTYRALMISVTAVVYLFIRSTVVSNLFILPNPRRDSRAKR